MEKPTWKKIDANSSKPCPRWGHSCCIVGDEILIFGGYAGIIPLIKTLTI